MTHTMAGASDINPRLIGRLAGLSGVVLFLVAMAGDLLPPLAASNSILHAINPDSQMVFAWASQNRQTIWALGFLDAIRLTAFAALVVLLVSLAGARGLLARITDIAIAAVLAVMCAHAAVMYALAEVAHRGGGISAVVALHTLAVMMDDFAAKIPIAIALGCVATALLRSRTLPLPLAWLAGLVAVVNLLATPAVIAGAGIADLISFALVVLWAVVVGVVLLIKPVWGPVPAADGGASHPRRSQRMSTPEANG